MKYKDPITGEFKDITIKAGDTLPVGAILEFDGDVIPAGYEEVTDEPEIETKEVFVGPNEPTTGEEVWLQKGKNLIKDASYGHINVNTGITDTDTSWFHSKLINVKDNAPYTFSLSTTDTYQQWIWAYYKEDGTFISAEYGNIETGNSVITKIIPINCNKVRVAWRANLNYSNVQLELGDKATSYEPYIDKKIYTKNDNGVYEEFTTINSGVVNGIHYIKFPDGTLIQRGNYNTTNINPNSSFFQKVDFPIPFIDDQYAVSITKCSGGSGLFSQVMDSCWRTTNYIEFTNWNNDQNSAANAIIYSWEAVGRWK